MSIRKFSTNLLPYDGIVHYKGRFFNEEKSQEYFGLLKNRISWEHDRGVLFGKKYITKRKVAWYGDKNFSYGYSKQSKIALPWTKELLDLKLAVEKFSNCAFNSCLLNYYHNGDEGMGWHSDDEKSLRFEAPIASLSFGPARKFVFKHKKSKEKVSVLLENGSILMMKDSTQTHWLHSIPKSKKVQTARINLTFRQFA